MSHVDCSVVPPVQSIRIKTLRCYEVEPASHQRVAGCCRNTTVVLSVFSHVDVAFVSPVLTPAAER